MNTGQFKGVDLVGHRYGRLTVVERIPAHASPSGRVSWRCACICGGEVIQQTGTIRAPQYRGGCKACEPEVRAAAHLRHGGNLGGKSRLYTIWKDMRRRCRSPKNAGWRYYGGKGVTVANEWGDFAVFRDWALSHGYADHLTIDRLDSNGNYEPGNCEWVTRSVNSRRAHSPEARAARAGAP